MFTLKTKYYSFEDWFDLYEHEVDLIIKEYRNFIYSLNSKKFHIFMNEQQFYNDIAHLIYQTSCNKDRKKVMYL